MPNCAVINCKNSSKVANRANGGITYHRFPRDPVYKEKWIEATGNIDWFPSKYSTICSIHFKNDDFVMAKKCRRLCDTAYPTILVLSMTTNRETKPYDTNAGNLPVSSSSYTNEFAATSNKVTVLCPKCNTNVEQIVEGIQLNQTKPIIAKVYHYFEQEYEELKEIYKDLDLTPLSKFTKRTALATGVSETTVLQILNEEEQWNAAHKEEPPQKRRRVPKRPRETDSSHEEEEDSSDDNDNDDEHPGNVDEPQSDPELETLQVKIEPPDEDCDKVSPDPLAVKVEPRDDEQNNSNKTVARNEPGSSTLKGKTKQRPKDTHLKHYSEQAGSSLEVEVKLEPRDDEPDISNNTLARNEPGSSTLKGKTKQRPKVVALRQQLRQGGSSTAEYTSNVPANEEFDESSLLGARGVKMEIEIDEEGFS